MHIYCYICITKHIREVVVNERDDIELLQQGHAEAFERLFHQYAGKLYNFLLKLSSGDTYLAEEIVQRTFIKIWDTHTQINPNKSFGFYLCTIARNMLMNEYQHQTAEFLYKEYASKYLSTKDNVTPEKVLSKNLLQEYIDQLTEMLPPARKQIFVMSRKEMLSNKEIAEKLNISESTIQTQLSKALAFMKERLSLYYKDILLIILFHNIVN
ncbi:RNA polymerase sigma-70 factor [Parabacteroides sp. Marseille-P3160]|uniref:RNA polymerase sigma-70 factor n=1 Tax=Parabacteroides sp. Marseille-P3160 TaxID=1917887 RepID=UPI0009BB76EF|nr:RNA polymerase sigma-70 factor [Parabacteroides sp. Marseille-P3160]